MTCCPKPSRRQKRVRKRMQRSQLKTRGKRTRKSGGALFPKRRDYVFQAWVRAHAACLLHLRYRRWNAGIGPDSYHRCTSPVRVCHIKSRGAGGDDRDGNIYGGCDSAHDEQHRLGIPTFEKRWGVDLKAEAARLWAAYQVARGRAAYVAQQGRETP